MSTGTAAHRFATFPLWFLRALGLWLALLGGWIAAGRLVPIALPVPAQEGPLTTGQAFLLVNALTAVVLGVMAQRARVGGWRLGLLVFVAFFTIGSAMMQIETLWFNDSVHMPLAVIGNLVLQAAIVAAITAIAGGLLFHPSQQDTQPLPANIVWRVVLMAPIYVVIYYTAGFCIAWQSEAVRAYYSNGVHIALLPTMGLQLVRGLLWALIALFIVTRLIGSLASRAVVLALLFSVLTAAQLLYPNPLMPTAVRLAHLVEVGTSEFVYGLIVTTVLLAGAAGRSRDGRQQLLAGQA